VSRLIREKLERQRVNVQTCTPGTEVSYHFGGYLERGRVLGVLSDGFKIDCERTNEVHTVPLYSPFLQPVSKGQEL
jgi:hypothetical protein